MADRDELKAAAQAMINATNQRAAYVASGTEDQVEFAVERFWAAHDALQKAVNAAPIQPVATQEDAGNVQAAPCPDCHVGAACSVHDAPVQAVQMSGDDSALILFTEWFIKNYPGPDTIIHKPEWHAPRIYRALKSLLAVAVPASQPSNAVQDAQTIRNEIYDIAKTLPVGDQRRKLMDMYEVLRHQPAATVPPVVQAPSDEQICEALQAQGMTTHSAGYDLMDKPATPIMLKGTRAIINAFRALTTASNAGEAAQGADK